MSAATPARGFSAGDSVGIDGPSHPWHGHAVRIDGPGFGDCMDWWVSLARYAGCATSAAESDLRLMEHEAETG